MRRMDRVNEERVRKPRKCVVWLSEKEYCAAMKVIHNAWGYGPEYVILLEKFINRLTQKAA